MNINDTSQLIEQKIKSRKTITANIVICPDTVCRQMYIRTAYVDVIKAFFLWFEFSIMGIKFRGDFYSRVFNAKLSNEIRYEFK